MSEQVAGLARRVLEAEGGDHDRAAAALDALCAEVGRIALAAQLRDEASLREPLRAALSAAGLGELAPEGASLATIRAGLARLHRFLAALAATRVGRKSD